MEKIVVDTSIIVKWFFTESESDKALEFLWKAKNGLLDILVPELAKYEFCNVLVKGKSLKREDIFDVLTGFYALPVTFISETLELSRESCAIAKNLDITYYDACFLALAQEKDIPLVTANPKHQKMKDVEVISI